MNKHRTIAITGATGFIGKLLVEKHLQLGDTVKILSRKKHGWNKATNHYRTDLISPDMRVIESFLDGAEVIYNCAGEINNQSLMNQTHVEGTKKLLFAAKTLAKMSMHVERILKKKYGN